MIQLIKIRNFTKIFIKQKSNIYLFVLLGLLLLQCKKEEENQISYRVNAVFSVDTAEITEGETIHFTDQSTNNPTSWEWDFGDGSTSNEQNPGHKYSYVGIYTVSLIVSNDFSCDTVTNSDYIIVTPSGSTNDIGTLTDIDGNTYLTVTIGNQEWMAENLRVTKYADGTDILLITNDTVWDDMSSFQPDKAYCWYDNDISYKNTFGALYTWTATMNSAENSDANPSGIQGVCPDGWHLPSDAEWTELENYLIDNGYNYDGSTSDKKIGKSIATTSGWTTSSTSGDIGNDQQSNNSSGFSALPSGMRNRFGSFGLASDDCFWWSSTEDLSRATIRYLTYTNNSIYRYIESISSGFSVRCVKDSE